MNANWRDDRLKLARLPTPLELLPRVSEELGREIWIKRDDTSDTLATGNKIRKLEYALAAARAAGASTLVTCGATQSNHARATAAVARRAGFAVHLVLLGDEQDRDQGNHLLDRILGAEISYVDLEGWGHRAAVMRSIADDIEKAGGKAWVMPEGGSDSIGTLGYVRAAEEILEQGRDLGLDFDHLICALGTGGTMAGLVAGFVAAGEGPLVHGICVCNDEEYFRRKTAPLYAALAEDYLPGLDVAACRPEIHEAYKGKGYGRSDARLRRELVELARLEGLVLDPVYTMKAWQGLRGIIDSGRVAEGQRLVFLHSGGIFGLLARGDLFREF